ncbi:MAG TPA: periplasmic heavy metal sensor [Alphaproteobacteria bacterium]|nr:periplasmic heavy metal sensor [Alphaproteobacteria bacterium]
MSGAPIRAFSWRALPWVLFTISLALNVFFVGGHFYSQTLGGPAAGNMAGRQAGAAKPTPKPARPTVEAIGLDVAQRGQFRDMRTRIRSRGKQFREGSRDNVARLWAELEKAKPSKRVIDRNLRKLADNSYAYQRRAAAHAIAFMAGLDANQKARFLEIAKGRGFLGAGLLRERPRESN